MEINRARDASENGPHLSLISPKAKLFLQAYQIAAIVAMLADQIVSSGKEIDLICPILNGACFFGNDLFRALSAWMPERLEYQAIQLKRNSMGVVDWALVARRAFAGRSVLIVDTIFDTGETASYAKRVVESCFSREVNFACLLARHDPPEGSFSGMSVKGNTDYFVGYGLDRNGKYRGMDSIWSEPPSDAVPESALVR